MTAPTWSTPSTESSSSTMTDSLDDQYLEWLYNQVGRQVRNIEHWDLLYAMQNYDFVMLVPNDDNRMRDGEELRKEFTSETGNQPSNSWMSMGCTVMEMLIGVARHLSFEMDGEVGEWFWHLVGNLGVIHFNDRRFEPRTVEQVLENLVWRQYNYDGSGGLFPLREPHQDQRHVEIWFQMESYMLAMS